MPVAEWGWRNAFEFIAALASARGARWGDQRVDLLGHADPLRFPGVR